MIIDDVGGVRSSEARLHRKESVVRAVDAELRDAFLAGQGANLNADADGTPSDSVMHVADLATREVVNTQQASIACPFEVCDPRVPYRIHDATVTFLAFEPDQGPAPAPGCSPVVSPACDLNGDFDGTDLVVVHFNLGAYAMNVGLEGSFDALEAGSYGIVLGAELAKALGVKLGERVVIATPQPVVTPAGIMARMRGFKVVGIFSSGMYEFDRNLAYIHMADAAKLYRMGNEVTGLRLKLDNMFVAPRVVRDLAMSFGGGYYVDDWTRKHANFFRAIQLTKSVMFVILLLVVAVAAFNIISTLVMVVKDKQADIAILRTIGASPRSILGIFVPRAPRSA